MLSLNGIDVYNVHAVTYKVLSLWALYFKMLLIIYFHMLVFDGEYECQIKLFNQNQ